MREIYKFVLWRWQNWETWQKLFVFAMLLQVVGMFIPGTAGNAVWGIGFAVILYFIAKWFIWDTVKSSWQKYKSHRNELLTTIKDSDK